MRAVTIALALLLLVPVALAQTVPVDPQGTLSLSTKDVQLHASNETTLYANVTNTGRLAATASFTLGVVEGWTIRAEPRTVPIAAGQTQQVLLILRAPSAGQGALQGRLDIRVTLSDPNTLRTSQMEESILLHRVDPLPPVPPPRTTPLQVIGFVAGTALVIAGVAWLETRRRGRIAAAWRAREMGLAIELEGPMLPWGLRRELLQRIAVRNLTDQPRVAHVGMRETMPGWTGAVSLPRLALGPGERALLTLYLNPGDEVAGGAPARFVVYARTAEAQEHEEHLVVELEAPPVRIPGPEASTTIALRDGSAVRPSLRR